MNDRFLKFGFRLLAMLTAGSIFLPVVFLKLPSPFRATFFYFLLWVFSVALFHYDLLFKKSMLYIYLFIVLFFFGINTWWSSALYQEAPVTFSYSWAQIQYVLCGVLMYSYFLKVKDFKGMAWVVVAVLGCIIITTIVSIYFQINNPEVVRKLMAGSVDISVFELVFGTYAFYNAVAFAMPVFAFYIKDKQIRLPLKVLIVLLVALLLYPMIQASLTTTFLIAIIFFSIALFARGSVLAIGITVSIILFLSLNTFRIETGRGIASISGFFDNGSILQVRLADVAETIELGDYNFEGGSTYFAKERLSRVAQSWDGFLTNPFLGGGDNSGHAFWLDHLASFGMLGMLPWILIFGVQIKIMKRALDNDYFRYYLLSIVMIMLFGCMKSAAVSAQTMLVIFFLIPGAGYLRYLRKDYCTNNARPLFKP